MTPCVLLISPGIIKWTDMDFGLPHLVSMGGYLQHHVDVRVELLDLNYEGGDQARLERTLDDLGPFLCIGVSCFSSFDYMRVMTLGRFLKKRYPDVPLVTGGYHASALPGDVVFDGSPFDAVVVGEGEVPMLEIVQTLLGGERLEKTHYGPSNIQDLDALPPYRWELLKRYWPRAKQIGRKLQVYLSRGCPYHCTFCMERAKTEYKWRAYSADRAVAELERLASFTDLSHWVVNLADPLFGFKRRWRRQVLEGIIERGLKPRQYWTLTRSDDLDVEDVKLLAAARFSIGIGLESGSPEMLTRMQKGNTPGKYLEAMKRLARLSRAHGLNWASNIIVGHPGETMQSMEETRDFLWSLFTEGRETCGWLSIDPFRLYPGAFVHEQMDAYEKQYGARFYHRRWWASWYDGPFKAQHIDPSHEVDYETRVRFMYDTYQPLVKEVASRFLGQGRSVDKVFARSLEEQVEQLSPKVRDTMLRRAQRARQASENAPVVRMPIGLHVKDERVRNRELAVRRLLERGVVRTERLLEALLRTPLEPFMGDEAARATLRDARATSEVEGDVPRLGISTIAMALEALEPAVGARVGDPTAANGYVAALLAALVTEQGTVVAGTPNGWNAARKLTRALTGYPQIDVVRTDPTVAPARGAFDGLYIGGALPQRPTPLLKALEPTGRLVTVIGPRFATQELVCLTKRADGWDERVVARLKIPVLRGKHGWLRAA